MISGWKEEKVQAEYFSENIWNLSLHVAGTEVLGDVRQISTVKCHTDHKLQVVKN